MMFFGLNSFAQISQEPCGADAHHDRLMASSQEYRKSMDKIRADYEKFLATGANEKSGEVYTIPIVFHVFYVDENHESNISDAQVQSAVDGMNIQWRNMYPDGTPFDPNGSDLKIEFCLAQRDPNGNPTTGIVHVDASGVPDYSVNGCTNANEVEMKALSTWPNTDYYNVWVVWKIDGADPWGGGTKGYAQLGPNPAASDGTVVLFNSTGYDLDQNGNDLNQYPLFGYPDNGTMVHECGHAFSLLHTFSGQSNSPTGASCTPETNCATQGDQVCDTKQHEGDLGTCRNPGDPTCAGDVYDVLIANNFMNYCSCPSLYTQGQSDKARNMIANSRSSLLVSDACIPVFDKDVMLKSVNQPKGLYCDTLVDPEVTVKNLGSILVTDIKFGYTLDGGTQEIFDWTGSIINNTEATITLPTVADLTVAPHTLEIEILEINNDVDQNTANNYGVANFEVIDGEKITISVNGSRPDAQYWELKDKGGTVLHSGNADNVSLNVCLVKDCYDFEMMDEFNFVGDNITYSVTNEIGAPMVEGWTTPRDNFQCCWESHKRYVTETNEFCLPFDPGYLTAEFEADKLVIREGSTVNFTDLSFGGDPATSWLWDFGDGGSSTLQNPSHQYANAGVYTVWLEADNIHNFPSKATKKHYIRVVKDFDNCTPYNNLLASEIADTYQLDGYDYPGSSAKYVGHAERFWVNEEANVSSVTFTPSIVTSTTAGSTVRFHVYQDGGGKPGSELAVEEVELANLTVGSPYTVSFGDLPAVNSFYYIGYDYKIQPDENFAVGASIIRGADSYSNTTVINENGSWKTVPNAFGSASTVSLDLTVNLTVLPLGILNQSVSEACVDEDIPVGKFDASLSENFTSIEWTFEDGSPSTSNDLKPAVSFNNDGSKEIKLTVVGGCGISLEKTGSVTVTPSLSATASVVNEVCDGVNGILNVEVIGGSGVYNVEWKEGNTVKSTADEYTSVPAGTYTAVVSDGRPACGVITIPNITVQNNPELDDFEFESNHTTCGQDNGYAKALPKGGTGSYIYEWNTTPVSHSPSISSLEPGTYSVTVNDGQCPPKTQSVTINASAPIVATVTPLADTLCYGTPHQVKTLTTTPDATHAWYLNGTYYQTGGDIDTLATSNMLFEARYSTPDGCELKLQSTLIVPPAPVSHANTFSDTVYWTGDSVKVNFTSAGSQATSYFWEFGDGATTTLKNPFHYYSAPGDYTVYLTAQNGSCTVKDSCTVVVVDDTANNGNGNGGGNGGGGGGGVSIDENNLLNIELFPNPTQDDIFLEFGKGSGSVTITDISGKVFSTLPLSEEMEGKLRIPMDHYQAGVYLFKIKVDGKHSIKKVLKID